MSEQPTLSETDNYVCRDHQVIEHAHVDQLQRGLQRLDVYKRQVQDRPHVTQLVGLNVPRAYPLLPICLLASLGAEELRIGGVVAGVVGLCVHADGLVWWKKSARRFRLDA